MAFKCVVVTPEQQVLDEQVEQVILPIFDGLLGVQTHRAPMLAKLGVGAMRIDLAGGRQVRLFIDGGVAQMKDNLLTVLASEARPVEELNAQEGRTVFEQATAMKIPDDRAFENRQRRLNRGRAMQLLAAK